MICKQDGQLKIKLFQIKMKKNCLEINQHLYQLYPNLPKYANDPQQSQIIRVYDLLLKRFQGIYGREPKYFIRSPAKCSILGSYSKSVQMSVASFCSLQNSIICIALNGHQKIRVNHYQNAVYGQKVFQNQSIKWKYDEKNDQYTNILVGTFKVYSSMFNLHTFQGMDLLLFDDFIHDDLLYSKQAISLGIVFALHSVLQPKSSISSLSRQFCHKFLSKLSNLISSIKPIHFQVGNAYETISINQSNNQIFKQQNNKAIQFPKGIDIILAHSMTPMPKKMIQGKRQNLRACQIRIGIELIKNEVGATSNINSLRNFSRYSDQLKQYLNMNNKQLMDTVDQYIPKGNLSAQKIEQLTQKSLIQILRQIPYANNVIDQNVIYKPYDRIKFCIQEQLAIENLSSQNLLESIKQSYHNSRQLLQIGSDQIDDMIAIIKDLAVAWKIVGDGWGGYLLILCESSKSQQVVDQLANQFYMNQKNRVLLSDDVDQYLKIVGKPANGISILDPSSEIWFC